MDVSPASGVAVFDKAGRAQDSRQPNIIITLKRIPPITCIDFEKNFPSEFHFRPGRHF